MQKKQIKTKPQKYNLLIKILLTEILPGYDTLYSFTRNKDILKLL